MKSTSCRELLIGMILSFFFVLMCGGKTFAVNETKLLASDGAQEDFFGFSISISGNVTLIGAPRDDDKGNLSGSAYIYLYNGTIWSREQKLLASDGSEADFFGQSVSIYEDLAMVGAPYDDDNGYSSGAAYVFRWNGSNWVEEQKLIASDGSKNDYFGKAVSIRGDLALVGARGDNDNGVDSGSAYVFRWNGSN